MSRNKIYSKDRYFLNICKEPLMSVNIVFLMKKNFWLQSAIDNVLNQLQSSGLIQHAISQHAEEKYFDMKEFIVDKQKLTIQHFSGIFRIWLIGLLLSFFVFIIENLIKQIW